MTPAELWGQRRYLVPGLVFLGVTATLFAISGVFRDLNASDTQVGVGAIAAVVASGLVGWPLGLTLNIPFDLLFRLFGNYDRFTHYDTFCEEFRHLTARRLSPAGLDDFKALCPEARDRNGERRFFGFLFERFAPDAVRGPSQGRWETFHTIGGMISAILFAFLFSRIAIPMLPHDQPWWTVPGVRRAALGIGLLVVLCLLVRAWIIANEAGDMQSRWGRYFLAHVRRSPEILNIAAVDNQSVTARMAVSKTKVETPKRKPKRGAARRVQR